MGQYRRRLLLYCAAHDRTFERVTARGQTVWQGKCIQCRRKVTIGLDGSPGCGTTLEHIVPRTHGGTNDVENLAISCARCNSQKGRKLDIRRLDDPKLQAKIEFLRQTRSDRRRDPPADLILPKMITPY